MTYLIFHVFLYHLDLWGNMWSGLANSQLHIWKELFSKGHKTNCLWGLISESDFTLSSGSSAVWLPGSGFFFKIYDKTQARDRKHNCLSILRWTLYPWTTRQIILFEALITESLCLKSLQRSIISLHQTTSLSGHQGSVYAQAYFGTLIPMALLLKSRSDFSPFPAGKLRASSDTRFPGNQKKLLFLFLEALPGTSSFVLKLTPLLTLPYDWWLKLWGFISHFYLRFPVWALPRCNEKGYHKDIYGPRTRASKFVIAQPQGGTCF